MDSNKYLRQEVSCSPKLILVNISYNTELVQELLNEISCSLKQEELINLVFNITFLNRTKNEKIDTIRSAVNCLVDGALVETFKEELQVLSSIFITISNEVYIPLLPFISYVDSLHYKYINWVSGDVIFSTFQLSDEQSTAYKQLFID